MVTMQLSRQDMRKSSNRQLGGTAYLSLENEDDPFLHGIKYTLLCPHKSVSEIWNSSLVERRLLQRCHCYSPSTGMSLEIRELFLNSNSYLFFSKFDVAWLLTPLHPSLVSGLKLHVLGSLCKTRRPII